MHDEVTNRYTLKMNRKPITIVSLIPKQIYTEQRKLKKEKMVKKESLHTRRPYLLIRFFLDLMMMLFFGLELIC
jgi:hypothetical protein